MRRALFALALAGCYDVGSLSGNGGAGFDLGSVDLATVGGWTPVPTGTTAALYGVWSAAPGEAWVVGAASTVLHATSAGLAFDRMAPGFTLRAVAGVSAPTVGGDSGALLTRAADGWHDSTSGDATWYALWSGAAGDYWAAGSGGALGHGTAAGFKGIQNDAIVALYGLAGRGSELWAAGQGGVLVHVNGETPTLGTSGTTTDLHGVFADANRVVLVGDGGLVLVSTDGTSFTPLQSGTTANLYAVFGVGDALWAAGDGGTIVSLDAHGGTVERSGGATLRALGGTGIADLWAAGTEGTLLHHEATIR